MMMVMMVLAVMVMIIIGTTMMDVHVLQGNRIRSCLVQLIEIAAVHRNVGAAEAVVRITRIICKSKNMFCLKYLNTMNNKEHVPSGEKGIFGFSG